MCGAVPAAPRNLFKRTRSRFVIPAKAGFYFAGYFAARGFWIPASAGMTGSLSGFCPASRIVTCPRCLSGTICRGIPVASASVEPYAIPVCHVERSEAQPRYLPANVVHLPFAARPLGCARVDKRAASGRDDKREGLGRNDNRGDSPWS